MERLTSYYRGYGIYKNTDRVGTLKDNEIDDCRATETNYSKS
jgi:hypothetical protein